VANVLGTFYVVKRTEFERTEGYSMKDVTIDNMNTLNKELVHNVGFMFTLFS